MKRPTLLLLFFSSFACGTRPNADANRRSADEVRARFEAFNRAWEARDRVFIDGYFAHDPDMLLFFERRQLRGWDRVKKLYDTMFENAGSGKVSSTFENLEVKARGDVAYLAANFRLEIAGGNREPAKDEGRQTVIFEKRNGEWIVVHRHTSFQAPAGAQRRVPLQEEPGPLWNPTLEGAWRSAEGALVLATASYVTVAGIPSLPHAARYRIDGAEIELQPFGAKPGVSLALENVQLTTDRLAFRFQGGAWELKRVE